MKVLWKPKKSIQTKCNLCGSILEITEEDMHRDQYLDLVVQCPICENEINPIDEELEILNYVTYTEGLKK